MHSSFLPRAVALILASALLFAVCACSKPSLQASVISDQALSYFNGAVQQYKTSSFRSMTRSFVKMTARTVDDGGNVSESTLSYLQSFDSLCRSKDGKIERKVVSGYLQNPADPAKIPLDGIPVFFTCYVKSGTCYYEYTSEELGKYKCDLAGDLLSGIGLYTLGGLQPQSYYAVKSDGQVRADLHFRAEDCRSSQDLFIAAMMLSLLGREADLTLSRLSISSLIDEETGRFLEYTLHFTATSAADDSLSFDFNLTETFSEYDTTEELIFPDLSSYPERPQIPVETDPSASSVAS